MERLDTERFAVYAYAVGHNNRNVITEELSRTVACYRTSPCPDLSWEETIRADELDILIYLEIGMGPRSFLLAMLRLAPIQCVTWGHPETTGLPTIDYFLSSELMEPLDGDSHYAEKLVRLPNLSIWYEPLPVVSASRTSRSRLGLREDSFVYACTQSLFKFLPRFDAVFPRIAQLVPKAQFLFLDHPVSSAATAIFKDRLSAQFQAYDLDIDRYCIFSSRLHTEAYQSMHHHVDVFLDSIGWSGCNTTLEAIAYDLPIVTLPTDLMRGRHSAAFLTRMHMDNYISKSIEEYINFAADLAHNKFLYNTVRGMIKENKTFLYRDCAAIHGLQEFIFQATHCRSKHSCQDSSTVHSRIGQ
jgi:protein O-GlcNAc transferase